MAWREQDSASKRYCLRYRWEGKKLKTHLKTTDQEEAETILKIVQATLVRVQRGWLELPPGTDAVTFALSNGKLKSKPKAAQETRTLRQVLDGYSDALPAGVLESTTLATIKVHQGHFRKVLGDLLSIRQLTASHLQDYVTTRSQHVTAGGSPISPVTIKKELTTLSAIWNWALLKGYVDGPFPNKGLKFPKTSEKPPFQTWEEIERRIARGGLTEAEHAALWDSLFLTLPHVAELLEFVKSRARHPFITPKISGRTGGATKDRHPRNKPPNNQSGRTGPTTARPGHPPNALDSRDARGACRSMGAALASSCGSLAGGGVFSTELRGAHPAKKNSRTSSNVSWTMCNFRM